MKRVQVICNRTGESSYQPLEFKPDAGIYKATCCMCGAAEYREEQ